MLIGDRLRKHGKMSSYTFTLTARINWFLRVKPQCAREKNNLLIKMLEQQKTQDSIPMAHLFFQSISNDFEDTTKQKMRRKTILWRYILGYFS